ncbi:MAG: hypothetical protein ACFFAN_13735 [Promethearchaeota archaeon]
MLEIVNKKLDELLKLGSIAPSISTPIPTTPHTMTSPDTTVKPSAIVDKQKEVEQLKEKPPIDARRVCPQCNGTSFLEAEDRTQILQYMGDIKIYKKKITCKSCGYKFP